MRCNRSRFSSNSGTARRTWKSGRRPSPTARVTSVSENIIAVHTTYLCGSVTVIRTAAGLVPVDTAKPDTAAKTLAAIRRWDNSPIHTVIYTHGHIDHTSGITVIDQEADARGIPRPRVIAHRNVLRRLSRYEATHGFNSIVQGQQFDVPGLRLSHRPAAPR